MSIRILQGDCRDVMLTLQAGSIDSVVCDPPYELGFMGKGWDRTGVANDPATWSEALRVLKPGGHLLAFSGTRTYHRMVCAIEDVGFEIRDQIGWLYGSGFPKSKNLDGQWQGWGTALKPAFEPIVVARKPLTGTVAANVLQFGTGALNIDGCRVEASADDPNRRDNPAIDRQAWKEGGPCEGYGFRQSERRPTLQQGRWPANIIHDGSDEVLAAFPQSDGGTAKAARQARSGSSLNSWKNSSTGGGIAPDSYGDTGSAARFFYTAKSSRHDRNDGLQKVSGSERSHHPTVKPTDLMRYLCRLVTPPGGTVLDPFAGSGSTLKAAELEGFSAIGIELDPAYIEIAKRRIASDAPLFAEVA